MTLLDLLNQDGASLKRVSGTNGGEYAGPCPTCGGTDRFRVWPEQDGGGRYWCRGCSKQGDAIQYLRDFRGLSYLDTCHFLERKPSLGMRRLNWELTRRLNTCSSFSANSENAQNGDQAKSLHKRVQTVQGPNWQAKESTLPCDQWRTRAGKFVTWAEQQLWTIGRGNGALLWVHGRGLTDETIKAFHLGWNSQDWFLSREEWGLLTVLKDNGKPKKLWLPLGLVIPKLASNQVARIRVRRPDGDPRYYLVSGSETGPLIIPGGVAACIVVESELDAILLHQEAGDMVTAVALGSASNRPDRATAAVLQQAEMVLVSLDADAAGARAAWGWWHEHYPRARRWPTINGKDPGEAHQNGLDLRAWIGAAFCSKARG